VEEYVYRVLEIYPNDILALKRQAEYHRLPETLSNKKFLRRGPDDSRGTFFKKRPPGRRRQKNAEVEKLTNGTANSFNK
jgi:hypothetical protein